LEKCKNYDWEKMGKLWWVRFAFQCMLSANATIYIYVHIYIYIYICHCAFGTSGVTARSLRACFSKVVIKGLHKLGA